MLAKIMPFIELKKGSPYFPNNNPQSSLVFVNYENKLIFFSKYNYSSPYLRLSGLNLTG